MPRQFASFAACSRSSQLSASLHIINPKTQFAGRNAPGEFFAPNTSHLHQHISRQIYLHREVHHQAGGSYIVKRLYASFIVDAELIRRSCGPGLRQIICQQAPCRFSQSNARPAAASAPVASGSVASGSAASGSVAASEGAVLGSGSSRSGGGGETIAPRYRRGPSAGTRP